MLCTPHRPPTFFLLPLLALCLLSPARGTSYVPVADRDLAKQADLIVRAEIVDQEVVEIAGALHTRYEVVVSDWVKGQAASPVLQISLPGGRTQAGRGRIVFGVPTFEIGQTALFFLLPSSSGSYRVLHLMQGAFPEIQHGGEAIYLRTLKDAAVFSSQGEREEEVWRGRHAERFVTWLRDQLEGKIRQPDYLLEFTLAEPELGAAFTRLGTGFRWQAFDNGQVVTWLRHVNGQPGFNDGGRIAFTAARRLWNDQPNTPISLRDGGTTTNTTGFQGFGLRGLFTFSDLNNEIAGDFSCTTGGTLAVGGVAFIQGGGTRPWKGEPFSIIVEASITINSGVDCFFANNPLGLQEVYAHELGHTLGLGHSCGDSSSPSCASSGRLNNALMTAIVHNDDRGAFLAADDIEGIRFLYDPAFFPTACNRELGNGRYCRECGPCIRGEGDCNVDSDCQSGLTCAQNVGTQFGFRPNIDVCVDSTAGGGGGNGGGGNGGGGGGCPLQGGSGRFCTECGPCAEGQGDCDGDAECASGLTCANNVGSDFGFAPRIDVCIADGSGGTCSIDLGRRRFCSTCGPCQEGQGDCDSDSECAPGLICRNNIGANFGFAPGVDVCTP